MSKELEALEYLKPFRWEDKKAKEAYELLKKALTPPTAEEVCKKLSELHNDKIYYNKLEKTFYGINWLGEPRFTYVSPIGTTSIDFGRYQPDVIIMLGKFYQSLEEIEHERD